MLPYLYLFGRLADSQAQPEARTDPLVGKVGPGIPSRGEVVPETP
jgi:hypothetical protein